MLLKAALIAFLALACNAAASPLLPTSPRAQAVIADQAPALSKALAAKGLVLGAPVYLAIYKQERVLEAWSQGPDGKYRFFKSWRVCAMSGDLGPKLAQGDSQAPEGFYSVTAQQLNPQSSYHLSFNLGFPNAYDRGLKRTGGNLMVHGNCLSIGCYAMTDTNIEEIYTLVYAALGSGTPTVPVHIFPFRMTDANMGAHAKSPWTPFWKNLKEGYDAFETTGRPPVIGVVNDRYVVAQK